MDKSYWIPNPFGEQRIVALSTVNHVLASMLSTYGKVDEKILHEKLVELQRSFSDTSEMIYVEGDGAFVNHTSDTILTYSFWIGKHAVSVYEYERYCDDYGLQKPNRNRQNALNHPVVWVSWQDAVQYCNWLSHKQNLSPAYNGTGELTDCEGKITRDITIVEGYRLPTESEWAFAMSRGLRMEGSRGSLYRTSLTRSIKGKRHPRPFKIKLRKIEIRNARYDAVSEFANALGVCYDATGSTGYEMFEWCHDRTDSYVRNTSGYSSSFRKTDRKRALINPVGGLVDDRRIARAKVRVDRNTRYSWRFQEPDPIAVLPEDSREGGRYDSSISFRIARTVIQR